MSRSQRVLVGISVAAFSYAVLGNYVALPGYLRFLERGATSSSGNSMDMEVLWGATRTILWMYSFGIGAICLYLSVLLRDAPRYAPFGIGLGVVWLGFWSLPQLPRMTPTFYLVVGGAIMAFIVAAHLRSSAGQRERSAFLFATSILFFALVTWDICGLGSTGRILHPEEVTLDRSQTLLNAQTTKIMIASFLAWACLVASKVRGALT